MHNSYFRLPRLPERAAEAPESRPSDCPPAVGHDELHFRSGQADEEQGFLPSLHIIRYCVFLVLGSSVVERRLMVCWIVRSIPYAGPTE